MPIQKRSALIILLTLFFTISLVFYNICDARVSKENALIADEHLNIAQEYMDNKQYEPALIEFEKALVLNPSSKDAKAGRKKAKKYLKSKAQRRYVDGQKFYNEKKYEDAIICFEETLKLYPTHRSAKTYLAKARKNANPSDDDILSASRRYITQKDKDLKGAQLAYLKGRELYLSGDYEQAEDTFHDALELNPYHVPARRYLEDILARKRKYVDTGLDLTHKQRMVDVRNNWLIKRKKVVLVEEPEPWQITTVSPAKEQLLEKAQQIIPEINFNNAKLSDVIRYLSGITGINIIIDESVFVTTFAEVEEADIVSITEEENEEAEFETPIPPEHPTSDRVTISLKDVPLLEAMKYILRPKGLKYTIEDFAIVITSATYIPPEEFETRYYHLASGVGAFTTFELNTDVEEETEEGEEVQETITIKDVLEQSGVPWPVGSKIFLDQRTGTLIVRNTPSNLTIIEDILRTLDITPYQVMIQARFVELTETDAQDLGLEWILNDDWKFFKNSGNKYAPLSSRERLQINEVPDGFTKNLRFLNTDATNGNLTIDPISAATGVESNAIFSISGILTQPEFTVVLHALEQSEQANTLSSPQVTTINGQRAQIEVVREIIYPTEYEITAPTTNDVGSVITPPAVTPGAFETRDVGIILDVTPNVGADRKTINLTIIPEVSELVEWIDYGMPEFNPGGGQNATPPIPIIQPVFATQNVTTSVIVNDGETVVLGGLIREIDTVLDDKIPFLGDIPVLGNLFKKHAEVSQKRNLLIFVTAELITPSGEPFSNVTGQPYDEADTE